VRSPKRTLLVGFIGVWASIVLLVGIWLNGVANSCQRFGDLSAECFAPVGQFAFVAIVIGIALSGTILWWIASGKNSDKQL